MIIERSARGRKPGALAQLGERYTGSVEVSGSIPLCSTKTGSMFITWNLFFCFMALYYEGV